MGSEYLFFNTIEYKETKKSLLNSELSVLNSVEALHNYKQLRLEELNLKIKMKTLITQAIESIDLLEKAMPQTRFNPEKIHSPRPKDTEDTTPIETEQEMKRSFDMKSQLDDIKRKLAMLQ
ncbi:MAG: hypothetical protein AABX11_04705 [Nanoarchaeota archaeon]